MDSSPSQISRAFGLGLELDSNELVLTIYRKYGHGLGLESESGLVWTRVFLLISPDIPENNIIAQTQESRKVHI